MQLSTSNTGLNTGQTFDQFCQNLRIPTDKVEAIQARYKRITKQLNKDFWGSESETLHSLYVGSYGRNTDIVTSDVDVLFLLSDNDYVKYNGYTSNGQSALLQDVKKALQKTYSTSH